MATRTSAPDSKLVGARTAQFQTSAEWPAHDAVSPTESPDTRAQLPRRTFVIADAAGCYDGVLSRAAALVDSAAQIGVDAVKFQYCSNPARLRARRRVGDTSAYGLLNFPSSWLSYLRARCCERGVEFMCTVYLPEDIATVASFVSRFKVASLESTDRHFVCMHAQYEKPLLLSSGATRTGQLLDVVRLYRGVQSAAHGVSAAAAVDVLHCVSSYPCPVEEANLGVLAQSWYAYGPDPQFTGFSDHTTHPWTGALAVAAGARIVEFHIRMANTAASNPDYAVSRDPEGAGEYVRHIRLAEVMLGDGVKRVMDCEAPMVQHRVGGQP